MAVAVAVQTPNTHQCAVANFPAVFFHISYWYLSGNTIDNKSQLSKTKHPPVCNGKCAHQTTTSGSGNFFQSIPPGGDETYYWRQCFNKLIWSAFIDICHCAMHIFTMVSFQLPLLNQIFLEESFLTMTILLNGLFTWWRSGWNDSNHSLIPKTTEDHVSCF